MPLDRFQGIKNFLLDGAVQGICSSNCNIMSENEIFAISMNRVYYSMAIIQGLGLLFLKYSNS